LSWVALSLWEFRNDQVMGMRHRSPPPLKGVRRGVEE
jgi:hypothetical protein